MSSSDRSRRLFPPFEFYSTPLSDVPTSVGHQYESPEESSYHSLGESIYHTPEESIYHTPEESIYYSPEKVSPYRHRTVHSDQRSQSPHSDQRSQSPHSYGSSTLSEVTPPVRYQYELPDESLDYSLERVSPNRHGMLHSDLRSHPPERMSSDRHRILNSGGRSQSPHSYGFSPLSGISPPTGYQSESPDESPAYSTEKVSPDRHQTLYSDRRSQSPDPHGSTPLSEMTPPVGYQHESPDYSWVFKDSPPERVSPDRHRTLHSERRSPSPYSDHHTPLSKTAPFAGYQYESPDEIYRNIYPSQHPDSPDPSSQLSFSKTIALTSPRRAEPVVINIDVDPKPIIDTRNGERFVCNIALDVQSGGSGMLPPPLVPTRLAIGGAIPSRPAWIDPRIRRRRQRMASRYNAPIPNSSDLYTPKGHQRNIWERKRILGRRPATDPFSPAYFSDNIRSPETSPVTSAPQLPSRSIPWESTPPRAAPRAPKQLSPWKKRLLGRFQPPPSARMQ